jgi:rubrerythrin
MTWATIWLIGTAIIWRETAKERGERLRHMGIHTLTCPNCGYNLTGLREAKCPECGAAYTLDQLYASIAESHAELGGE